MKKHDARRVKINPAKLRPKTLKEQLAEMGDPEKIRAEASNIPKDLLDLVALAEAEESGEDDN